MEIRLVETREDFLALCFMLYKNEKNAEGVCHGFDCSPDVMCRFLANQLGKTDYRMWVLFDGAKYGGYCISAYESLLKKQIVVFDIYITPEYRGLDMHATLFYDKVLEWVSKTDAKRIVWLAEDQRLSREVWEKLWGIKVNELIIYTCEVRP